MGPEGAVGVGPASAPATLPDPGTDADLSAELVDLLCEDEAWLEETFRDIVATSWAAPPHGGGARAAGGPRRHGPPDRSRSRRNDTGMSQWTASPRRRQRAPPGA
jgi:hypothetical protein